jgi:homocysteine S-methyltransferase
MGERRNILILDGATGTELARRGVNVNTPIWSAAAMIDAPDILRDVHEEYLRAGANAIITNTFRTHERSLAKAGLGHEAGRLTSAAVRIAMDARDRVRPEALVLGSVAPLEDCYEPAHAPPPEICFREHAQQIERLLEAGVDRILIETMNIQHEALAAAEAAQQLAPGAWMISFCAHGDGPPGVLLSGQPLVDVLPQLSRAIAVGVNCVAAPQVMQQVQLLRTLLPVEVQVMAYANVGHCGPDGRTWIDSDAANPESYADYAALWADAGGTIIGGCCGTTPDTIRAVARRLGAVH